MVSGHDSRRRSQTFNFGSRNAILLLTEDAGDDADLYANLIKWWPYLDCDAKSVLTIDQVIKSTNKAVTEMKGK